MVQIPDEPAPVKSGSWSGDLPQDDHLVFTVTERDTAESDKYEKVAPVVRGTDAEGKAVQVIGWRSHLRQVIQDEDPQPGDTCAFKFFGPNPEGRGYLYGLTVERA